MTAKEQALKLAKEETERSGRKYVVREDHGRYHVVPLYERGSTHIVDHGYAGIGILVKESL